MSLQARMSGNWDDWRPHLCGLALFLFFLMGQSRPLRSIHRAEGWTPETIAAHGMPALKSSFYKLDRSADIFNWDAI